MKRIKNFIFPAIILAGLGVFFVTGRMTVVASPYEGRPEVVAATFTSAWCSSCKVLEPKLAAIIPEFAGSPVKFIEFDFTLGSNAEHKAIAAENGLTDVYPRFEGATGYTLLIDRDTGEIIDMLTMSFSKKAMRAAIAQSIAQAVQPVEAPAKGQ